MRKTVLGQAFYVVAQSDAATSVDDCRFLGIADPGIADERKAGKSRRQSQGDFTCALLEVQKIQPQEGLQRTKPQNFRPKGITNATHPGRISAALD